MQLIINYLKRIPNLFYFLIYFFSYKKLNIRAVVFFSNRVQGKKHISIGRNSVVQRGGWLLALKIDENEPVLSIGDNCAIGDYCHITSARNVVIEDSVLIANNVYISDNLHSYEKVAVPIINQKIIFKSAVIIKSGAWIGENVCIIGATIGKNSVIGANSVVTTNIPDYSIALGTPAKVIKIFDHENNKWIANNEFYINK